MTVWAAAIQKAAASAFFPTRREKRGWCFTKCCGGGIMGEKRRRFYAGLCFIGKGIGLYGRGTPAGTGAGRRAGVPHLLRGEPLRQLRRSFGLPADERHGRGNDGCHAEISDGAGADDRYDAERLYGQGGAKGIEKAPESAD